jgi:hypothetical protein
MSVPTYWQAVRLDLPSDSPFDPPRLGGTPSDVLCRFQDSVGGPVRSRTDQAYAGMFDTILGHLDDPDLGLGSPRVAPVTF